MIILVFGQNSNIEMPEIKFAFANIKTKDFNLILMSELVLVVVGVCLVLIGSRFQSTEYRLERGATSRVGYVS